MITWSRSSQCKKDVALRFAPILTFVSISESHSRIVRFLNSYFSDFKQLKRGFKKFAFLWEKCLEICTCFKTNQHTEKYLFRFFVDIIYFFWFSISIFPKGLFSVTSILLAEREHRVMYRLSYHDTRSPINHIVRTPNWSAINRIVSTLNLSETSHIVRNLNRSVTNRNVMNLNQSPTNHIVKTLNRSVTNPP